MRRIISRDLGDRQRRAVEEEETSNPVLAELRERARQATRRLADRALRNSSLIDDMITSFKCEVDLDLQRRVDNPDLPWGPSYLQVNYEVL